MNTTVGTKGYALFEYQGPATSVINILPPFTYAYDNGWKDPLMTWTGSIR